MRKKVYTHLIIVTALLAGAPAFADSETDRWTAEARSKIKTFATRLQGELKGALKTVGPQGAIGVCNIVAPELARQAGEQSPWTVGRTALRLRNASNAPDAWERRVLEDFVRKQKAGANPAKLERHQIVEKDGKRILRYMKAIPTGKVCLTCHGGAVKPALLATIRKQYPDDQATGFQAGDIRGAFTLSRPLP